MDPFMQNPPNANWVDWNNIQPMPNIENHVPENVQNNDQNNALPPDNVQGDVAENEPVNQPIPYVPANLNRVHFELRYAMVLVPMIPLHNLPPPALQIPGILMHQPPQLIQLRVPVPVNIQYPQWPPFQNQENNPFFFGPCPGPQVCPIAHAEWYHNMPPIPPPDFVDRQNGPWQQPGPQYNQNVPPIRFPPPPCPRHFFRNRQATPPRNFAPALREEPQGNRVPNQRFHDENQGNQQAQRFNRIRENPENRRRRNGKKSELLPGSKNCKNQ